MKANELRVGNKINVEQTTHTVKKILSSVLISTWDKSTSKRIETYRNSYDQIKPIPLTEEILLKCDCVLDKKLHTKYGYFNYWFNSSGILCINLINDIVHIKYLHQLQNLYFALTNTELNIEL